jgi:hypothetical protein
MLDFKKQWLIADIIEEMRKKEAEFNSFMILLESTEKLIYNITSVI